MWLILSLSGLWAQAQTPLEGLWLRPCQAGNRQIQNFEGSYNTAQDLFFSDRACQKPMMAFLNEGPVKVRPGEIDFQFKTVKVALYLDTMVVDYNQRAVCGLTNWRKNSPQEVTGLQCAFFQAHKKVQVPKEGEGRYGIWRVEFGRLNFGLLDQHHPGTSPDLRPVQWDLRDYFKQR